MDEENASSSPIDFVWEWVAQFALHLEEASPVKMSLAVRLFLLLSALGAGVAKASPVAAQDFNATQIRKTGTVRLDASPEEVFSLLTPLGQKSLARSWDVDILSPSSGAVEAGATFTKTHRRAGVQQVWTVVAADAPWRISYAIFVADLETWVFEIELRAESGGTTSVHVTHTITSLSPEANAAVQEFADTFEAYLSSWTAGIRRGLEPKRPTPRPRRAKR